MHGLRLVRVLMRLLKSSPTRKEGQGMKDIYTIINNGKDKKGFWLKIGVAFENQDGSLNVALNCLPLDGKLHIRDRKDK